MKMAKTRNFPARPSASTGRTLPVIQYDEQGSEVCRVGMRTDFGARRARPAINGGSTRGSPVNRAETAVSPVYRASACRPVLEHGSLKRPGASIGKHTALGGWF